MVRSKPASVCGPSLPTTFSPWTMPAQLTRPRSGTSAPKPSTAAATAAFALASSVTSVRHEPRRGTELRGQRPPFDFLEVGDDDAPAAGDDHARGRRAQPRRAAGDDEAAPLQLHAFGSHDHGARRSGVATPCFDCALNTVMAADTSPARFDMSDGTISVLPALRESGERVDVLLGDLEVDRLDPPGDFDRLGDLADRPGVGLGEREDRRGVALRLVDLGLLFALGLGDRRRAGAVGQVDLLLLLAFGGRDHRALLALRGDLRLHRVQDLLRRGQVLDLVAEHLDAPVRRRLVERRDDDAR